MLNTLIVELVVRNVSGGAVKDITLELSGSIEDSSSFVLSDVRYLREGGYPSSDRMRESAACGITSTALYPTFERRDFKKV